MLVIGSDHGGFLLKQEIKKHLEENKIEYIDVGCYDESSVDYPDIAKAACDKIVSGECQLGILICGTGIGIGWKAGIAAEVLGLPKNSIGKALYNAKIYLEMPDLFCWTAVIILLSLLFEKLAALLLRVLTARLAVEKEGQR